MAREFLRLTPEATPGQFDSTQSSHVIVDLDQNNAYTVRPARVDQVVRTVGAGNRRLKNISNKKTLGGNLNLLLHGSQGNLIAPWVCADATGAIKSMTIDHCIVMEDSGSSKVYSRDLGVMVQQAQFNSSEQDQLLRTQLQLVGMQRTSITGTDFPEPVATDYASDAFYVFEQASGALTIGTSRSHFETFNLTIKNMLDVRFFCSNWAQVIKYCGRDVDWVSRLMYEAATDRSNYESNTPVSGSLTFTNGSHSLAFAMETQNYITKVNDDLALDKVYLQEIELAAFYDPSAGTPNDFTLTAS